MTEAPTLKCEICGQPALGVASSTLGAISHAYCRECLTLHREVWTTLVGGLYGCTRGVSGEWVRPVIEATCAFYGKTEDELWAEVAKLEEDYDAYMEANSEHAEANASTLEEADIIHSKNFVDGEGVD